MMNWKAGVVAALVGVVCVGCGGEAPEASAGEGPAAAASEGERVELATAAFSVEGMTCGGCAIATEISVRELEGVSSVEASYDENADEGRATVEYDPGLLGTDAIAEAIRGAGFEPTLQTTSTEG